MFKRIISNLLYVTWLLLAVFLLLLLAEYVTRYLKPDWAPRWQERSQTWIYHPQYGWFQKPTTEAVINHQHFSIRVQTNSHGLRDKEYTQERSNKKRMLVLGDSFVWGYGVEHEQRFTEIIENRNPDWEIINAGISGYGTDQEYLYYVREGYTFKPDVVVLLLYYNDFENNYEPVQYGYHKPYFTLDQHLNLVRHNDPVPVSSLIQKARREIDTNTYLLARLVNLYDTLFVYVCGIFGKEVNIQVGFSHVVESLPVTNILLKNLANEVEANHSRFVLLAVPARKIFTNNLDIFTREENMDYLNLDIAFTGHEEKYQIPGDDHWNAKGHQYAADVIERFLIEKGILNTQSSSFSVEKSAHRGK